MFRDEVYRYKIKPKLKLTFGYRDMFFFEQNVHYTKEYKTQAYWNAGSKLGIDVSF